MPAGICTCHRVWAPQIPMGLLHPGVRQLHNEAWELGGLRKGLSWLSPSSLTQPSPGTGSGLRLGPSVARATHCLRGVLLHDARVWARGQVRAWAWSIGLILSSSESPHFWLCRGGFGYIYSSVTEGLGSASPWGQSGQDGPGSPGVLVGQTDNKPSHKRTRKPLVQNGHRMRWWEGSGLSVEASFRG